MGDNSLIAWTDATWNPITGCSQLSAGCTHCYAQRLAGTRLQHHPSRAGLTRETAHGPVWTGEVRLNEQWMSQPLHWQKSRRVFVCAHSDLFHPAVNPAWRAAIFGVMAAADHHCYQVLTKRTEAMSAFLNDPPSLRDCTVAARDLGVEIGWPGVTMRTGLSLEEMLRHPSWPLPNVWCGTSIEDQAAADERIPHLLRTPAAVRWLSVEPMLGPVDLELDSGCESCGPQGWMPSEQPSWIVVGAESGPHRRPCDLAWVRSLVRQCRGACIPVFVKQLDIGGRVSHDPEEWPEDLRVREYPGAVDG